MSGEKPGLNQLICFFTGSVETDITQEKGDKEEDTTTEKESKDDTVEKESKDDTTEKENMDDTMEKENKDSTTQENKDNTTEKESKDDTTEKEDKETTIEKENRDNTVEKEDKDNTTEKENTTKIPAEQDHKDQDDTNRDGDTDRSKDKDTETTMARARTGRQAGARSRTRQETRLISLPSWPSSPSACHMSSWVSWNKMMPHTQKKKSCQLVRKSFFLLFYRWCHHCISLGTSSSSGRASEEQVGSSGLQARRVQDMPTRRIGT